VYLEGAQLQQHVILKVEPEIWYFHDSDFRDDVSALTVFRVEKWSQKCLVDRWVIILPGVDYFLKKVSKNRLQYVNTSFEDLILAIVEQPTTEAAFFNSPIGAKFTPRDESFHLGGGLTQLMNLAPRG
jgi:hypothetical protein